MQQHGRVYSPHCIVRESCNSTMHSRSKSEGHIKMYGRTYSEIQVEVYGKMHDRGHKKMYGKMQSERR